MKNNIFFDEVIESKNNPKIKFYKKLMNSKKVRYGYQLFVLEGSRLIFDALKSKAPITQLYFTQTAFEKYSIDIENLIDDSIKINVISDEIGRHISSTENTQGVFAQCGFSDNSQIAGKLKTNGKYAVLHKLQDPGNAGVIIRTADALGLDGVIFCESCDVYNPKVVRATMGSMFRIPIFRDVDAEELFIALSDIGLKTFAAVVNPDSCDVKKADFSHGGAVFIGNEGNGLDSEITAMCSQNITIKMNGNTESINAAMAAGIIMWELMRSG